MLSIQNHLGVIRLSRPYLAGLVVSAVTSCFGVAGLSEKKAGEAVRLRRHREGIAVDLHILVVYGVNISETVRCIKNKVAWVLRENAGVPVTQLNVYVDAVKD